MYKIGEAVLGNNVTFDEGVLLAYLSPRRGVSEVLRIGDGAVIRAGTIIYAGSTIGAHLETEVRQELRGNRAAQPLLTDDLRVAVDLRHAQIDPGRRLRRHGVGVADVQGHERALALLFLQALAERGERAGGKQGGSSCEIWIARHGSPTAAGE